MNIPEDTRKQIEEFAKQWFRNGEYLYEYGTKCYSLSLPKIEAQQQEIDLLKQSNTYQLSQIGKLFADKMELADENKRLKAEIERLEKIVGEMLHGEP